MKNSQKKHIGKSLIIASWVLRFLLFLVAFFTQKVAILIVIAALSIILLLCSIKYRNDFDITKEAFLTKETIISHIRLQTKEDYRYSVGLSSLWTIAVLGIMWYSSSHKGNFDLGIPVLLWLGIPTVLLLNSSFSKFKRVNYEISEILQNRFFIYESVVSKKYINEARDSDDTDTYYLTFHCGKYGKIDFLVEYNVYDDVVENRDLYYLVFINNKKADLTPCTIIKKGGSSISPELKCFYESN